MKLKVQALVQSKAGVVSTRCHDCGKNGSFVTLGQDVGIGDFTCGQRQCPDPNCKAHIFVVVQNGRLVASYPPARVEFNSDRIPAGIRATFEEALDCHAHGLSRAAAMMVRRTLEEICEDRGASGGNLKDRLTDLRSKIVLPQELLDALDDLRLLGNDAAHIEAKTFAKIDKAEIDAAIELTQEVLKGLFQYAGLLDKLRALKQP